MTSSSASSSSLVTPPRNALSFLSVSPEVASYFIGTLFLCLFTAFSNSRLSSWRMCRSCIEDCSLATRALENHPVRVLIGAIATIHLLGDYFRQVQPRHSDSQYKGVWRSLVRMWKEEGFRGFMRGNGINCLRIVPYRWDMILCFARDIRWLNWIS